MRLYTSVHPACRSATDAVTPGGLKMSEWGAPWPASRTWRTCGIAASSGPGHAWELSPALGLLWSTAWETQLIGLEMPQALRCQHPRLLRQKELSILLSRRHNVALILWCFSYDFTLGCFPSSAHSDRSLYRSLQHWLWPVVWSRCRMRKGPDQKPTDLGRRPTLAPLGYFVNMTLVRPGHLAGWLWKDGTEREINCQIF